MFLIRLILLLIPLRLTTAYNILVVNTWPGKSHYWTFSKVYKALAEKKHNITVISFFNESQQKDNYESVQIDGLEVFAKNMETWSILNEMNSERLAMYLTQPAVTFAGNKACDLLFKSRNVQEFLRREIKFDVMIVEDFYSECTWVLVQKYNCPVIRMLPHVLAPWSGKRLGNPLCTAYVPNIHIPLLAKMSFFGRLENSVLNVLNILYFDYFMVPTQKSIAARYMNVDETTFDNRFFNTSLVLINTHFTLNWQMPLVPNIVEVGGIHIGETSRLTKVSTLCNVEISNSCLNTKIVSPPVVSWY